MNKLSSIIAVAILMTSLTGCSMFSGLYHKQTIVKNRDYDYLQSHAVPSLQVPQGASNVQIGNDYPIPGDNSVIPTSPVSIVPPGSLAAQHKQ